MPTHEVVIYLLALIGLYVIAAFLDIPPEITQ